MYRLLLAVVAAMALAAPVAAFHSGGVGECTGCHFLHRPVSAGAGARTDNAVSLTGTDPGSTCLRCHMKSGASRPDSHLVATAEEDMAQGMPPVQLSPGGDFGWLKKSYRWSPDGGGAGGDSPGELHGHNIVAGEFRYVADTRRATAPGGTFPSSRLSCISCHDPHGKYRRGADGAIGTGSVQIGSSGSYSDSPDPTPDRAVGVYRLLGGKGYATSLFDGAPFVNDPPAAVAPAFYNRSEELGDARVAYGRGMSEWCANCHSGLLDGSGGGKTHPAGNHVKFTQATADNYNAYVASGNLTGNSSTSYTSMTPFEMGTSDYAALKSAALSGKAGPGMSSNVMCLSCHRAHASGWDHAARWNMNAEFLVYNGDYPGIDAGGVPSRLSQGRTRAEVRKTFGDRPATAFATYQRSLCNKCHARD